MTAFKTLDDIDVAGKSVLVRADLNLPMIDGKISDATRLKRLVPTLNELSDKGAKVVVMSHFGRPKGAVDANFSLGPVAGELARVLGRPVAFATDCIGEAAERTVGGLKGGEVALLENLRFHPGEEANDDDFAARLAALGEIYVDDAFSVAHRAQVSVGETTHDLGVDIRLCGHFGAENRQGHGGHYRQQSCLKRSHTYS